MNYTSSYRGISGALALLLYPDKFRPIYILALLNIPLNLILCAAGVVGYISTGNTGNFVLVVVTLVFALMFSGLMLSFLVKSGWRLS